MPRTRLIALIVFLAGALCIGETVAESAKYPDLQGVWRGKGNRWPIPAPLTPEYRKIFEANLKDQADGGHGDTPTVRCLPPGMPRIMNVYDDMQIVITPEMIHMLIEHVKDSRRIYTDGRTWPAEMEPMWTGYSIGKWSDTDGDGTYDTLDVETRGIKLPRTYDLTGIPFHADGKAIVKERMVWDKSRPDVIRNEITTIDNALLHPWTITKTYRRAPPTKEPYWWREAVCAENNPHVRIGDDTYMLSADGYLMPTRKDQPPPDLRYFSRASR